MRIEEVIGQRLAMLRESLTTDAGERVSQSEFGRRLEPLLGKPWSRQAVWRAESGNRSFTAAELVAVAHVLGAPVGQLFDPPLNTEEIELPGGRLPAAELSFERIAEIPDALRQRAIRL